SGIPAREVLVAATSRAAASAGLAGVTGALLPGYDADLVVVGGNPLEDLADLHDLELVLQRGGEFIPEPFEAYEPPSGFGDPPARIVRMRSDRE
ncbi:amidohydrolase family protein, partial [Acinetobacter nosocomialis]|uniref:amidohydrolase family protein n=1 Tax=Acinetobacter nosocomialis TaxID=106654 RepID=UPI003AF9770F